MTYSEVVGTKICWIQRQGGFGERELEESIVENSNGENHLDSTDGPLSLSLVPLTPFNRTNADKA